MVSTDKESNMKKRASGEDRIVDVESFVDEPRVNFATWSWRTFFPATRSLHEKGREDLPAASHLVQMFLIYLVLLGDELTSRVLNLKLHVIYMLRKRLDMGTFHLLAAVEFGFLKFLNWSREIMYAYLLIFWSILTSVVKIPHWTLYGLFPCVYSMSFPYYIITTEATHKVKPSIFLALFPGPINQIQKNITS